MRWLLLAALPLAAQENWTPLFDGRTLNGWERLNGTAPYTVENGEIVGRSIAGSPNSFLCTKRPYGDFILEFEVMVVNPDLNSGVQIRSHQYDRDVEVMTENRGRRVNKQSKGRVYGYQVEIANEAGGGSGGIYDEARRGWVDNIMTNPVARRAFRDRQWNRYRIEARGPSIKTFVNGVACADLLDVMDLSGFIGLQVHQFNGPHPSEIRWRHLRIQDLGEHTWQPLFDGRTLDGWHVEGSGTWKIEDGALHGQQTAASTERGFLVSDAEFGDFALRLRYKSVRGNSGVFFRMGDATSKELNRMGYEVEVDPTRDPGGLQEPGGRRWLAHTGPIADAWYYRAGDWNEMVIIAQGRRIVIIINGIRTAEVRDDPGRLRGRLALQLNPRQNLDVFYKDIALLVPKK
jgi:hypothetical protein